MKLIPRLTWQVDRTGGDTLDPRLLPLLRGVREHGTLGAAARAAGLSYRLAWNLLGDATRLIGLPPVLLEQGRGAQLALPGIELLEGHAKLERELSGRRIELSVGTDTGAKVDGLRIIASHDLALAELCERLATPVGTVATVSFRGSLESLAAFARGDADVAGFHLVSAADSTDPLAQSLDGRKDRLVRFAEREQGLIVRRGNPRRLQSLQDLTARGVRFINRQRGSGTRLLLDHLLSNAGVAAGSIRGYANEEHTHLAVAATVASGGADAGFGLKAAAARLGLDFVSIAKERYWLAIRARDIPSAPMTRFLAAIKGPKLKEIGRGLPGYSLRGAGTVLGVRAGLG